MADVIRGFSDGSCYPNPGPGGWASVVTLQSGEKRIRTGGELESTNNRMEIMGALGVLCEVHERSVFEVYSDSQYVVNAFNQGWIRKWKSEGKFGTSRLPNNDLWVPLVEQALYHTKVTWHWVRGHSGHQENEEADKLACDARVRWSRGERW